MVSLVDQMLEAKKKLHTSTTERDKSYWENKCTSLDREIDQLACLSTTPYESLTRGAAGRSISYTD